MERIGIRIMWYIMKCVDVCSTLLSCGQRSLTGSNNVSLENFYLLNKSVMYYAEYGSVNFTEKAHLQTRNLEARLCSGM